MGVLRLVMQTPCLHTKEAAGLARCTGSYVILYLKVLLGDYQMSCVLTSLVCHRLFCESRGKHEWLHN